MKTDLFCWALTKGHSELTLARTEIIEEVQLLPVNDHLAPAQFDELVLGQEAEESLLMPDE